MNAAQGPLRETLLRRKTTLNNNRPEQQQRPVKTDEPAKPVNEDML
ncbi:hypothetical protein [Mucilaginibacter terrae]|uniref:Uncharacterized protein n=1 Tax=Mucilaginibacter terrae TaxID=1955052 RepID=A0ABU3GRH9_9SPHI|nr:hypothetical protein [Mucilaginibacter terrae]MDT3402384.1 hypothetical protein [Mucilaginibacter terrae]